MTQAPPTHLPTTVHAEGEVSYRRKVLDFDLNEILEKINHISPPLALRESIQKAVLSVEQKMMDKDAYIDKLHQKINDLESQRTF
ncbi:hypothetical protein DSO57_1017910 [Entomophthora muscae]|uniref:Uncharacterized protein n=1 Tax=Entomophthora muscae TaxID=34485 RepID=A0ACC2RJ44_9FUNG|nr:hypothetical protein DSO57_1017910 [Entomophthora muscae]